MPVGTQIDKATRFPFRKAGGFLCLLRLLPQAPCGHKLSWATQKILRLRDCKSLLLDKQISPPGWTEIIRLLRIMPAAYPHGFQQSYQRVPPDILFCDKCSGIMKRNVPDKKRNPTPWYRCTTRGCDCRIMKCEMVEHEILDAMEEWLDDYIIQLEADTEPAIDPIETALITVRGQISTLQSQQENICEYLEKGIYTIEMFTKRNLALENEIKQLQESEEDLLKQKSEGKQKEAAHTQIIPAAQHILESYPILTLEEKNRLWKLVLKKITIYRSPDDDITIRIHPNLPK